MTPALQISTARGTLLALKLEANALTLSKDARSKGLTCTG